MIQNVVKVPFRKLKHIHHISDIQIRNLKRHTEYEEVFNRLYEKVKENKDNAIAYIGGDIAHSKTDMSPELVDQLSRLFKNLSDIVPLVIIAGNHDCNLNNRSRMDVLTPIVENLNHPNLHYLKDSGILLYPKWIGNDNPTQATPGSIFILPIYPGNGDKVKKTIEKDTNKEMYLIRVSYEWTKQDLDGEKIRITPKESYGMTPKSAPFKVFIELGGKGSVIHDENWDDFVNKGLVMG